MLYWLSGRNLHAQFAAVFGLVFSLVFSLVIQPVDPMRSVVFDKCSILP